MDYNLNAFNFISMIMSMYVVPNIQTYIFNGSYLDDIIVN